MITSIQVIEEMCFLSTQLSSGWEYNTGRILHRHLHSTHGDACMLSLSGWYLQALKGYM